MKFENKNGSFASITLTHGGVKEHLPIPKLVCTLFNGPPPTSNHREVNAVNGNRLDNRPENLYWSIWKAGRGRAIYFPQDKQLAGEFWEKCRVSIFLKCN